MDALSVKEWVPARHVLFFIMEAEENVFDARGIQDNTELKCDF